MNQTQTNQIIQDIDQLSNDYRHLTNSYGILRDNTHDTNNGISILRTDMDTLQINLLNRMNVLQTSLLDGMNTLQTNLFSRMA